MNRDAGLEPVEAFGLCLSRREPPVPIHLQYPLSRSTPYDGNGGRALSLVNHFRSIGDFVSTVVSISNS